MEWGWHYVTSGLRISYHKWCRKYKQNYYNFLQVAGLKVKSTAELLYVYPYSQVWHNYFFKTNNFPIKPTGKIIIAIWHCYKLMKIFYLPLDRLLDFLDPVHRKNDQRNTHCSPAQILRLKDFCRNQLGMDVKTCNQFPLDNSIQESSYQPKKTTE